MVNYKLAHVPLPAETAQKILDTYDASKDSGGGLEIRYRIPKEAVAMTSFDGEDYDPNTPEITGLGLGVHGRFPIMLQPRQMIGFQSAKEKGKPYVLVLNRAQLRAAKGQGLFKDIASIVAKIASPLLESVAPGSSEGFEKVADKVIGAVDNAILRPKAKKAVRKVIQDNRNEMRKLTELPESADKAHKIAALTKQIAEEMKDAANKVMGSGGDGEECDAIKVCSKCCGSGVVKRKQKNLKVGM